MQACTNTVGWVNFFTFAILSQVQKNYSKNVFGSNRLKNLYKFLHFKKCIWLKTNAQTLKLRPTSNVWHPKKFYFCKKKKLFYPPLLWLFKNYLSLDYYSIDWILQKFLEVRSYDTRDSEYVVSSSWIYATTTKNYFWAILTNTWPKATSPVSKEKDRPT